MNMFISTWVLLVAGLVFALPMIYLRVKDHTELADETLYAPKLLRHLVFCLPLFRMHLDNSGNTLDTPQVRQQLEERHVDEKEEK